MNNSLYLSSVRARKPLVHHITNWVTIYDCAQIVKSFGASPVMAHAPEEAAAMASLASSLVLNIGTLTADIIASMKIAARRANEKGIPVVLDVCGAGATRFRDDMVRELLGAARIDIIKGNASEVARVAGEDVRTKGVDAGDVRADTTAVAQRLARDRGCTVAVTGKIDVVADAARVIRVGNGHEMMARVVGTGCMAASVIGTFAAVSPGLAEAAAAGLSCFGIAAERAALRTKERGPAAFKEALLDEAYLLDGPTADGMGRIE